MAVCGGPPFRSTSSRPQGSNPCDLLHTVLIRIVRFQNFLFQLSHSTATRLTDLALQNGYYDQSHLIREFKNYTDLTPNQFAKTIDSSHYLSRLVLTNPAGTEQEI